MIKSTTIINDPNSKMPQNKANFQIKTLILILKLLRNSILRFKKIYLNGTIVALSTAIIIIIYSRIIIQILILRECISKRGKFTMQLI